MNYYIGAFSDKMDGVSGTHSMSSQAEIRYADGVHAFLFPASMFRVADDIFPLFDLGEIHRQFSDLAIDFCGSWLRQGFTCLERMFRPRSSEPEVSD